MKTIVAFAAIVLLASSTASAAWIGGVTYAVPGPVVYESYMPAAPYYAAYPTPYYAAYPARMYAARMYAAPMYSAPMYAAPRVVYRPAVMAPPMAVYSPGVAVYPRVFVPGQPVRNVLRATLP
jgi:hypothetical protein